MTVYWGVNLSHNGSICQLKEDGEIDWFSEEERFSRQKNHEMPMSIVPFIKYDDEIKPIQVSGLYEHWDKRKFEEDAFYFSSLTKKFYNKYRNIKQDLHYELYLDHHLYHAACGFYNSGFDSAALLVVDGAGNYVNDNGKPDFKYHEVESIWGMKYPNMGTRYHVNVVPSVIPNEYHSLQDYPIGIGMIYSAISDYLGFGTLESGKIMGLSAYGSGDTNIKPFLVNGKLDSSQFYRTRYGFNFIPYDYVNYEGYPTDPNNPKFKNICNLTYRLQKDFEDYMIGLIQQTLKLTGEKNLVLTGGCALNCVANYKYLSILPDDVKLYVEPISTDAGTAIGLAKLNYYAETQSTKKNPLKTLYLGLQP